MASMNWSTLYKLSVAGRTKIVTFIKADPVNHEKLVQACAVEQEPSSSELESNPFNDPGMDDIVDQNPSEVTLLDQQQPPQLQIQQQPTPLPSVVRIRKKTLGTRRK
jgi:hypothetical protein